MLKCGQIQESLVNVGFFQFFRKLDVSSRNLAETWAFMGKFGSGEISQFFWKLDVSSRNHAETWAITGKFGSGKISLFFFEKTGRIKQKPCWNAGNCRKVWFLPDLTDIFENWVELVQTMLKCGRLRKVWFWRDFPVFLKIGRIKQKPYWNVGYNGKAWFGEISPVFRKLDGSGRNHSNTWVDRKKICCADFLAKLVFGYLPVCQRFERIVWETSWNVDPFTRNGLLGFSDKKGFSCLADHPVYFAWTFSTSWFIST